MTLGFAVQADPPGRLRVAHLISDLDVGGAERMLVKLAGALRGEFDQLVVCITVAGPNAAPLEALGVPVVALGMQRGRPTAAGFIGAVAALRRFRPQVIQTWLYHADLLGTLACPFVPRARLAWNLRCSDLDVAKYRGLTRLVRTALAKLSPMPAVVVVNSDAGAAGHQALGYRPRRWAVIPNGFDLERFRPDPDARQRLRERLRWPSDARVVGMIARLDPQKDHAGLLAAARALAAARTDVRFLLVGPGVPALAGAVADSGLAARVVLEDTIDDVAEIFAALDLAVLSSLIGEGFPNVIGEAMACGVPCVATDVGDTKAIIGDTGLVVPPGDPAALARALNAALEWSANEYAARSRAARARIAANYSLGSIAERYAALYRELAQRQAARGDAQ